MRVLRVLEVTMRDGNDPTGGSVIFPPGKVLEVTMRDGNPSSE